MSDIIDIGRLMGFRPATSKYMQRIGRGRFSKGDIDLCLECREDTSLGSGRFVNRIPAYNDGEEGWMCEVCQTADECVECDKAPVFGEVRCEEHGQAFEREIEDKPGPKQ